MNENILKAVQAARSSEKKRNFSQSFDLIVNLKFMDVKKPENRINEIFVLPRGRGKDASVAFFTDTAKSVGCTTYGSDDIERLARDRREMKKSARTVDFFLSEPKLMPAVGKGLGWVLAPRGKMPVVVGGDFEGVVERHKSSFRIRINDSPVIQCIVGIESMKDEDVT